MLKKRLMETLDEPQPKPRNRPIEITTTNPSLSNSILNSKNDKGKGDPFVSPIPSDGDHFSKSAFDNPVFQHDDNDDDDCTKPNRSKNLADHYMPQQSMMQANRSEAGGKSHRRYSKLDIDLESPSRQQGSSRENHNRKKSNTAEDTFLHIENEVRAFQSPNLKGSHSVLKNDNATDGYSYDETNETKLRRPRKSSTTPKKSRIKHSGHYEADLSVEEHTTLQIEDELELKEIETSETQPDLLPSTIDHAKLDKLKSSKTKLVEKWKSFIKTSTTTLSRSQSQDQSLKNNEDYEEEISKSPDEIKDIKRLGKTPKKEVSDNEESSEGTSSSSSETDSKASNSVKIGSKGHKPPSEAVKEKRRTSAKNHETNSKTKQGPEITDREIQKRGKRRDKNEITPNKDNETDLLFGITIHASDLLPVDPNILHPVVKVSLINTNGDSVLRSDYLKSSKKLRSKRRNKYGRDFDDKKYNSRERNREDFESEKGNASLKNSLLPIMTQPYEVTRRNPTLAPTWNELILYEEPYQRFIDEDEDYLIFFEVMDFLPMNKMTQIRTPGYHGSEIGWYKIAWAFLKPVGANGAFNVERKVRLQLFKPMKLRAKDQHPGPEVYSWWKSGKREKLLNTTLYVTVKGVLPPTNTKASLRQLISMKKNELTEAIIESQLAPTASQRSSNSEDKTESSNKPKSRPMKEVNWVRLEGQSCRVPNKLIASLPLSKIQSLNITISGNVYCVKFSPCGMKLAAGLDTEDLHVVLLFDFPSGNLLRSLKGHHGLIYDLNWKLSELREGKSSIHYLASASADSTAIIWSIKNGDEETLKMNKILHHPSFVYCVIFHPTHASLVVTGCFDNMIRVWSLDSSPKNLQNSSPLFILDRHQSFVNCLIFDLDGHSLFSGDGNSCLYKWTFRSPTRRKSWKIQRDVKLTESGNIPINSLSLHPKGSRILVHLRNNCAKILDMSSLTPIQSFTGFINDRLQIKSCFSPCGNLVLSGSEDSKICIWDADTGSIMQFINPKNHANCFVTSVDYHPLDFYMVVGLASKISEPSPILIYGYDSPHISSLALVQTGISKFRSNLRKGLSVTDENNTITGPRRNVSFANNDTERGDSSEKFTDIINKLDKALREAQDPTRISRTFPKPETNGENDNTDFPDRFEKESRRNLRGNGSPNSSKSIDMDIKSSSKSPRTYIEGRLEELIFPESRNSSTERKDPLKKYEEIKSESKNNLGSSTEDPTLLLSPKNIPQPAPRKNRPNSSKIPVRLNPNSPVPRSRLRRKSLSPTHCLKNENTTDAMSHSHIQEPSNNMHL